MHTYTFIPIQIHTSTYIHLIHIDAYTHVLTHVHMLHKPMMPELTCVHFKYHKCLPFKIKVTSNYGKVDYNDQSNILILETTLPTNNRAMSLRKQYLRYKQMSTASHTYTHVHTFNHRKTLHAHTFVHMYAYAHIYTYTHNIYIYTYSCSHTYTHIHIHIHTFTHIHMHNNRY